MEVVNLKMDDIFSDATFNCRLELAPIECLDLARDIEKNGLQTPITVQRWDKHPPHKYRIVAGHRRHMAHRINKAETIHCFLQAFENDFAAASFNLRENLNRRALNLREEANGLKMYKIAGWSVRDTAQYIEQSQAWVQIRYMVLALPDHIQIECGKGILTQEHVRFLYGKTILEMESIVRHIKDAKIRGTKFRTGGPKKVNHLKKKVRLVEELNGMIDHLFTCGMMGIHTRFLAWAAGSISTYELHRDIKEYAESNGMDYQIPEDVLRSINSPTGIVTVSGVPNGQVSGQPTT